MHYGEAYSLVLTDGAAESPVVETAGALGALDDPVLASTPDTPLVVRVNRAVEFRGAAEAFLARSRPAGAAGGTSSGGSASEDLNPTERGDPESLRPPPILVPHQAPAAAAPGTSPCESRAA